MLMITLSGVLSEDCITKTDRNGHSYIRFQVVCDEPDFQGRPNVTIVRCYCYNMKFADLKKGDLVFLSGSFKFTMFNGKMNADVYVQSIANGKNNSK